jgi:hypothetical protein
LDSLAALTAWTKGAIKHVTTGEAEYILKIHSAAPEIGALTRWRIAREYIRRESDQRSTTDLDLFLAFSGLAEKGKEDVMSALQLAGLLPVKSRIDDGSFPEVLWDLFGQMWGEFLFQRFMVTASWALQEKWEKEHPEEGATLNLADETKMEDSNGKAQA